MTQRGLRASTEPQNGRLEYEVRGFEAVSEPNDPEKRDAHKVKLQVGYCRSSTIDPEKLKSKTAFIVVRPNNSDLEQNYIMKTSQDPSQGAKAGWNTFAWPTTDVIDRSDVNASELGVVVHMGVDDEFAENIQPATFTAIPLNQSVQPPPPQIGKYLLSLLIQRDGLNSLSYTFRSGDGAPKTCYYVSEGQECVNDKPSSPARIESGTIVKLQMDMAKMPEGKLRFMFTALMLWSKIRSMSHSILSTCTHAVEEAECIVFSKADGAPLLAAGRFGRAARDCQEVCWSGGLRLSHSHIGSAVFGHGRYAQAYIQAWRLGGKAELSIPIRSACRWSLVKRISRLDDGNPTLCPSGMQLENVKLSNFTAVEGEKVTLSADEDGFVHYELTLPNDGNQFYLSVKFDEKSQLMGLECLKARASAGELQVTAPSGTAPSGRTIAFKVRFTPEQKHSAVTKEALPTGPDDETGIPLENGSEIDLFKYNGVSASTNELEIQPSGRKVVDQTRTKDGRTPRCIHLSFALCCKR